MRCTLVQLFISGLILAGLSKCGATVRLNYPGRLPKYLTEQQVSDLLNTPDVDVPLELRDKAMLELLYATGFVLTVLVSLTIENTIVHHGVMRVIGKGNKERIVPMGKKLLIGFVNLCFMVACSLKWAEF